MVREVCDAQNTRWSCVQAHAGLTTGETDAATQALARVPGTDKVTVVCTPSGGAQTRRLELASDWETSLSDEALAEAIAAT